MYLALIRLNSGRTVPNSIGIALNGNLVVNGSCSTVLAVVGGVVDLLSSLDITTSSGCSTCSMQYCISMVSVQLWRQHSSTIPRLMRRWDRCSLSTDVSWEYPPRALHRSEIRSTKYLPHDFRTALAPTLLKVSNIRRKTTTYVSFMILFAHFADTPLSERD